METISCAYSHQITCLYSLRCCPTVIAHQNIPDSIRSSKFSDEREKKLNILIQNDMKIYNWKEYGFVGTVADFAKRHCKCKAKTYVNSVKYVSRRRYNDMDGREQKTYDDKRKRAKRAYYIYIRMTTRSLAILCRRKSMRQ